MHVSSPHKNAVGNQNLESHRQFMDGEMKSIMTRNRVVASCLGVVPCTRVQLELGVGKEERSGQFKSIRTVFTTACWRANVPGASRHGLRPWSVTVISPKQETDAVEKLVS